MSARQTSPPLLLEVLARVALAIARREIEAERTAQSVEAGEPPAAAKPRARRRAA